MSDYERGRNDLIKEIKEKVMTIEQESKGVDIMIDILFLLKKLK